MDVSSVGEQSAFHRLASTHSAIACVLSLGLPRRGLFSCCYMLKELQALTVGNGEACQRDPRFAIQLFGGPSFTPLSVDYGLSGRLWEE